MNNLKTLKDLDVGFIDSWQLRDEKDVHPSHKQKVVDYEELKSEAVKWVKDLDIDIYHRKGSKMLTKNEISCLISTSEWIKHFFNLQEEDLKSEKTTTNT